MNKNRTIAQFLGIKKFPYVIKDVQGRTIYWETSYGYWSKSEYDSNNNLTKYEDSTGYWGKWEYDANGNEIYFENSTGYWEKREYDSNGKEIYFENSNDYWYKSEYDSNGNETYFEDSYSNIKDNRPKQVELTLAEIAEKLNIPLAQLRIKE